MKQNVVAKVRIVGITIGLALLLCGQDLQRRRAGRFPRGANRQSDEERSMPRYEFICEKCKKPFELIMTISEREKAKPNCPKCKGTKVTAQLSGFMTQTSKKS